MKFRLLSLIAVIATSGFFSNNARAQQNVFIDFDSATDGGDRVYSLTERDEIIALVEQDFERFDFSFTQVQPTSGDFSTLLINDGPILGQAEQIDFRNVDKNDNATINVNNVAVTSAQFVTLTANVASHEFGHLLGLRHFDSFGPIDAGIDNNSVDANFFFPSFNGPNQATETLFHLMEADNLTFEDNNDQFFGERSAIKLAFNEQGTVIEESNAVKNNLATAEFFELAPIVVPNTIEMGGNVGVGDFDVDAVAIIGSLDVNGLDDFFRFSGEAGDFLNVELISTTLRSNPNDFDTTLRLLGADGSQVDYFGADAFNDQDPETSDSILLNLVLPSDGDFVLQVGSFLGNETGDYELFVNRFNGVITAVPEPSAFTALLLFGIAGLAKRRRI